tara:strand:+ start:116 stop:310 length:195 start_codon:yes stop_codon:yes gene_type:complete
LLFVLARGDEFAEKRRDPNLGPDFGEVRAEGFHDFSFSVLDLAVIPRVKNLHVLRDKKESVNLS